ncbi:tyrosine-type recombinase/integrase [Caenimonas sedimenti]|uniref:Tyrosine-type recombinase/integrase n=1 Tax=Caenimonas sedimenti TaxID=2596921 RepID=A0A562ZHU4_9BURK|nr:phage integrase family protein [Caenimonas sedimenti]TWO68083.1 tyrosine-type recombinase/integrase [Caenimonas sedimenti]
MPASKRPANPPFPESGEILALRARMQGVAAGEAISRYAPQRRPRGGSARQALADIRTDLVRFAGVRGRVDLAQAIGESISQGMAGLARFERAIELLRALPPAGPEIGDEVGRWLPARVAAALQAHGIGTLAELTLRVPRNKAWWRGIPGMGPSAARTVERFFATHPELTARARALAVADAVTEIQPLERQRTPEDLDGSRGRNRAPRETCVLAADNDLAAIQAWLQLHESPATRRAYRKEAERLLLWAVVQLGKPLSSLTTEDANAYRAFLRDLKPRARWVGPHRPRSAPDWRPFNGELSPASVAYALTVINNLFGWLVDQRYLLANPFSKVKVAAAQRKRVIDVSHAFTEGEWLLVRAIANDLEGKHGWQAPAAERARFLLDFSYATGLRAGELVGLRLKQIVLEEDDWWIDLVGKGQKAGRVALPPLGRNALERYLRLRGISADPRRWTAELALVANMQDETRITSTRLWVVMKRAFRSIAAAARALETPQEALAEKLEAASPHWMRHTHARHALARGAELLSVRDNLRHASIATTSIYLQAEDVKRARQMSTAFQG